MNRWNHSTPPGTPSNLLNFAWENLLQQCFILKVFDCVFSMFVFSIRQDLDRIQRIFASCEAVGCLDTGVGGGGTMYI